MKRLESKLALCLIVAAAAGTAAGAQSADIRFPQTPAGKAVEAYFKAFNAGEEAMKAFFSSFTSKEALQKTPLDVRLDRFRQMRGRLQSLEPQKLADARDNFVSVVARTGAGELVRLDFEFEAAAPFGLLGIRIEDMGDGGGQGPRPEPKKDDAELVASVREYARRAVEAGEFSGVILIARHGKPFFEEAFGEADREKNIPNRAGTKFNVGSIDKTFTGLAIRQLAAEKKLALDDRIGKYLADYPNKDAAAKVTIRHLLEMTSGIGDFFGDRYAAADKEKIVTLADYLPLFADKPLEFEPGTATRYSNGGYVVLGLIIEKVTGADYYAYVRDHIFGPAGMPDSDWSEKAARLPGLAVGYEREGSAWKTNYDTLPGKGSSAGGGHSTARDLLNYTVALEKGIFGAAGESERGGFGIAGGAPGLNAAVEWDPRRGVTIVVMANLSPPSATGMTRQIRAWLPR
ncbi:MAG: serine hydrolase domain-containing protein [Candidatus Aminicenantales bacterium]